MRLEDLRKQGLLLPEEHWGSQPTASWRGRAQILVCGILFLVAGLLIWFGRGGWVTFAGIGTFSVDLLLFLVFTFRAVDHQVAHLVELEVGDQVEGMSSTGDETSG